MVQRANTVETGPGEKWEGVLSIEYAYVHLSLSYDSNP